MPDLITCRVNTRNLLRGLDLLRQHSKTAPAEALHRSVAFVVDKAKRATPSVDPGRINAQLAIMTRGVTRKGKPSKAQKPRLTWSEAVTGGPLVPASWLITSARAWPLSHYNGRTGGRWMFTKIGARVDGTPSRHPLAGKRVSQFAAIMAAHVHRMISRRHSSTHFFQVSWNPILARLSSLVPPRYRAKFTLAAGHEGRITADMGRVHPAGPGEVATCTIENRIGMASKYPNLDRQRNESAHRILTPILQAAVDAEWAGQVKLLMEQGVIEEKANLRQYGFE